MIKILIAENIPSLNKGEMAIYSGMCETFKVLGKVKVYMFSERPEVDAIRYKEKAEIININSSLHFSNNQLESKYKSIGISIWSFLQHIFFLFLYKFIGRKALSVMKDILWKTYLDADIVITGHNGIFGVGGGLGAPLYFMPFYIPLFSKLLGKPVVFYGSSISPSKIKIIKACMRFVLNRMDLITLREEQTYKDLKKMNIKNKMMFVLPDPAFLLKPENFQRVEEIMLLEDIGKEANPLIGITITRIRASFINLDLGEFEKKYQYHIRVVASIIDKLVEQINANIVFIPHCIGLSKDLDDRIVSSDIYTLCKNKGKVKVITTEYTAEELKGLIGKCDLFIGERIHSVIGAISMGVPSLAVSQASDRRLKIISGVFKEKDLVYEIDTLNESSLLSKIIEIWNQREIIKERLTKKAETLSQGAMKNGELLKEIFEKSKKSKLNV